MSPDDETKKLDAPWPFGPWAHKKSKFRTAQMLKMAVFGAPE